ncbi:MULTISPECIES: NADPH-dependent 7-cyano-7-deazaguanine reductase QueF [Gammaproteobacteria]|jgi:7-cyano-7-deazaguanine reductase|uniref:NADPH-dependent 7-cyano-7-deazaguanine reductase n=2 Tax=Alteromonas macleodii TaxID=28108 RepID=A0A1E7DHW0_ALTMA|nr:MULTISPECIES: NADPH-dependent 7-cyano-7-deazaguanine reductase QueF [Gammaproteobacteria]MEC8298086.1 NADPH-dependent 7-cyano-7-deazaguanine reductase QueF [Pseudomonadota bacterium]AFS36424.1 7-cyano-7-deazaguanine reductase [Alteromonas macleodii ATCC 27126]AFT73596.1 7-cyano-7-deazaguanine reductase [Alteromonas macleodii str. 'English Channel 673']MBL3808890.1 NADPH-dependent 7-cyano-7-deazaguanine reductase QueF [Alteromonas macleodii]MBL3882427.1 NADPH-dependent 7-cyano-7-deazaguanine|tara:strand:+ start:133 stop:993 length:861 start_codon:yes stop_codon:yes gene_type:complete
MSTDNSPQKITISAPDDLSLGKQVDYEFEYNPGLLQGVPRSLSRDTLNLAGSGLPFDGIDTWTGYELSWLNLKGKPNVAILECHVPITSKNLIESKSFKLYLNSFNQTKFASAEDVRQVLQADLSACAGEPVEVKLILPEQFSSLQFQEFNGTLLDSLDVEIDQYSPNTQYLTVAKNETGIQETLVSHLLKSNCLITSQPDWASIQIRYEGKAIEHEGLLKYLISFRQHNEFHEQCVERIYNDIMQHCQPDKLTVCARYTRRGGLDINPFRSNYEAPYANHRQARQ